MIVKATRTYSTYVSQSSPQWKELDTLSFLAKNVYNSALYLMRQSFFDSTTKTLQWNEVVNHFVASKNQDYYALPAKVSSAVIREIGNLFTAFYGSLRSPNVTHKVSLPRYKDSAKGRAVIPFNNQTIGKPRKVRDGLWEYTVCPRSLNLKFLCPSPDVKFIRIVPRPTHYAVEMVYDISVPEPSGTVDLSNVMGIDIGVDNLATCLTTSGSSFIMNGRPIKSINRHYNKRVAKMRSELPKGVRTSTRIRKFTEKRNRKIAWELHNISRALVNHAVSIGVTTVIIGKNTGWKQDIDLGKVNNQKFFSIPHARFIDQLIYKFSDHGISVLLTEESYTSKASLLDRDDLPTFSSGSKPRIFSGQRIKRGLYRSADGTLLNADVNGAGNIIRKVVPDIHFDGIVDAVVRPDRVSISRS